MKNALSIWEFRLELSKSFTKYGNSKHDWFCTGDLNNKIKTHNCIYLFSFTIFFFLEKTAFRKFKIKKYKPQINGDWSYFWFLSFFSQFLRLSFFVGRRQRWPSQRRQWGTYFRSEIKELKIFFFLRLSVFTSQLVQCLSYFYISSFYFLHFVY